MEHHDTLLASPARGLEVVEVDAHMAWVDQRLLADEVCATPSVAALLGVLDDSALRTLPRPIATAEVRHPVPVAKQPDASVATDRRRGGTRARICSTR
jgi:hypothetical protein